ncbi:MAG: universal stress protein [Aquihabitans sp.]
METDQLIPAPLVVGVDGSPAADRALRWAAAEAAAWDVPLRVASVWSMPVAAFSYPGLPMVMDSDPLRDEARALAERAVEAVGRQSDISTVQAEALTLEGQAANQLLNAARNARALVLGRRGRGGFADLILGSVATACIHHATTAVVLVGDSERLPGSGPVVVGVDGSDGSRAAVRWAAAEAHRLGVRLVAVQGWEQPTDALSGGMGSELGGAEEVVASADRYLAEFIDDAIETGPEPTALPEIETRVLAEPAAQALLRAAADAALLVVGTRGRGGFAGLLLGSVSNACAHHAPGPVAVIPT